MGKFTGKHKATVWEVIGAMFLSCSHMFRFLEVMHAFTHKCVCVVLTFCGYHIVKYVWKCEDSPGSTSFIMTMGLVMKMRSAKHRECAQWGGVQFTHMHMHTYASVWSVPLAHTHTDTQELGSERKRGNSWAELMPGRRAGTIEERAWG